jgi:hypothetical protein
MNEVGQIRCSCREVEEEEDDVLVPPVVRS